MLKKTFSNTPIPCLPSKTGVPSLIVNDSVDNVDKIGENEGKLAENENNDKNDEEKAVRSPALPSKHGLPKNVLTLSNEGALVDEEVENDLKSDEKAENINNDNKVDDNDNDNSDNNNNKTNFVNAFACCITCSFNVCINSSRN